MFFYCFDPLSQPTVTIFAHISSRLGKTIWTAGLAEWIIDYPCRVVTFYLKITLYFFKVDFVGKNKLLELKKEIRNRKLVMISVEDNEAVPEGNESIWMLNKVLNRPFK